MPARFPRSLSLNPDIDAYLTCSGSVSAAEPVKDCLVIREVIKP